MNYGLYLSASGVLTNMYRQDVYANNLANVATAGFKPDVPVVCQRPAEAQEEGVTGALGRRLLDRLGGGAVAVRQAMDLSAGQLSQTNGPLDVALTAERQFLTVAAEGPGGESQTALLRDGRLGRDGVGYLIQMGSGRQVLGADGQAIRLNSQVPARIDGRGRVCQGDEVMGTLGVVEVGDAGALVKRGDNLFSYAGSAKPVAAGMVCVQPGYVEQSGTDPIRALMSLVEATKAVTANGNTIHYCDQMMDRAVNVLGRVLA